MKSFYWDGLHTFLNIYRFIWKDIPAICTRCCNIYLDVLFFFRKNLMNCCAFGQSTMYKYFSELSLFAWSSTGQSWANKSCSLLRWKILLKDLLFLTLSHTTAGRFTTSSRLWAPSMWILFKLAILHRSSGRALSFGQSTRKSRLRQGISTSCRDSISIFSCKVSVLRDQFSKLCI